MNKTKNVSFLSRYYTLVTVCSPLLMMYNTGISTITFLDVAIVIGYVASFFKNQKIKTSKLNIIMVVYAAMLILNLFITALYRDYAVVSVAFRTIRLVVYLLWVVVGGRQLFNGEFALNIWKNMSVFATFFLILQYVALNLFGISIPGYLPFLDVARDELVEFTENLSASSSARPRSIFAEPSQYGIYLTGFLMVALMKKDYGIKKWLIIFLFIGMILSASTTAFLGIGISLVFLYAFRLNQRKIVLSKNHMGYLILGIVILGIALVYNWQYIGLLIEKIVLRMPNSINNRLSGWKLIIEEIQSEGFLEQMFGFGMDADLINSFDWTSSVLKIWFYYGYIGIVIFLYGVCWFLLQKKKPVIWLVSTILLIGFFTELLVSNWLVLFVPFIQYVDEQRDNKQEVVKCG